MKKHALQKGFTIIELLVVVAIIGLLSAVILAALGSVQTRGRDARRVADIKEITKALNLYSVNNRVFPISVSTTTLIGTDPVSVALKNDGAITEMPKDPQSPTRDYTYRSYSSGSTYTLSFCLETDTIKGYTIGCSNTLKP